MSYLLNKVVASVGEAFADRRIARLRSSKRTVVSEILAASGPTDTTVAEADFDSLFSTSSGPGEYGYDPRSTWLRGLRRADQLATMLPGLQADMRVAEIGCGDGMAALQLATLGAHVELVDLRDWRDQRARQLVFFPCDLGLPGALPCQAEQDLLYSYNAFEHFPDPASVLERMVAKVKVGGYLFFEFGPLYAGPWGLHAYRMLPMPYPQYLFRESFWRDKIRQSGVRDLGQDLDELQPLNQWTVGQFDALWNNSGCRVLHSRRILTEDHLDIVMRYPQAFQGRGLTYDDLTTQAVSVLLQKLH